ncbi:MarC family protein [Rhodococcoides fascians]|uniref:MarC family protein n=1 Tax=Rhodococcoides fascians TaxID=1828 RepID=UPI0019561C07|nr:MarC family protein [Rhodococcus fascians]MDQ0284357.1 multiple antibiotic resistance protein [Rhodococcus fascians]
MNFDVTLYLTVLITLFVIMDPPGAIPVFLSLVGRKSKEVRNKAAWQAPAVSLTVISVFAIGGQAILSYLHIGIPALQGAGGLLLLLIALSLLTGKGAGGDAAAEDVNVALVPLGTPLMAGPGAIAAVIVYVSQADGNASSLLAIASGIITIHVLFFVILRFSTVLIRLLGEGGISLLARIAGLLLAAIAVQLIADSVRGFVAGA